jgi:hypothetical protein
VKDVTVTLTWAQARALAYASSLGLDTPGLRWPSREYQAQGKAAREELLKATAEAEKA